MDQHGQPVEGMAGYQQPAKKGRGCLFWGCLTFIILIILIIGVLAYGFYTLREKMTSTTPRAIPVKQVAPAEYEKVQNEISAFDKASKENRPAKLELTADDLNTLIAKNEDFKGKAFVKIQGDQVILDVSIPLDEIPTMKGRYFNGTIGVRPSIENEKASLKPVSAEVDGKPVPEWLMQGLREQDFLKNARDEKFQEMVKKAKSLRVQDGKIVIER
jgi:hypothetical protein